MAFLQMLKESGIVTVYLLSVLVGLESFSVCQVQIITLAIFGASMTVRGELNFNLAGFVIQMSSQVSECTRIVLQSTILSGRKLDPLSYVLLISPVCLVLLSVLMSLLLVLPADLLGPGLAVPSREVLFEWAPVLLMNCCVAFGLNLSIAMLIKHTSAMTYIFCGVLKDIAAVLVSVFLVHETVTHVQVAAFFVQVLAVFTWSLYTSDPRKFEGGIASGVYLALAGPGVRVQDDRHLLPAADGSNDCSKAAAKADVEAPRSKEV